VVIIKEKPVCLKAFTSAWTGVRRNERRRKAAIIYPISPNSRQLSVIEVAAFVAVRIGRLIIVMQFNIRERTWNAAPVGADADGKILID
jgi:hypothetical protein